jgi:hypothetical protein
LQNDADIAEQNDVIKGILDQCVDEVCNSTPEAIVESIMMSMIIKAVRVGSHKSEYANLLL